MSLTSPLARRPVVEPLTGMVVVDEQAVLEHQLLVGRVRKSGQSQPDHRDGGEHAEHELRPTLRAAHVDGTDQYPGHGRHEARNTGGGQSGVFGLYAGRHFDNDGLSFGQQARLPASTVACTRVSVERGWCDGQRWIVHDRRRLWSIAAGQRARVSPTVRKSSYYRSRRLNVPMYAGLGNAITTTQSLRSEYNLL